MLPQSPSLGELPLPVAVPEPAHPSQPVPAPIEHGGREGPEPTRFGDWEKNGRCIDF
ncbi:succinate dehydrogenase assembly factor 4 [Silanimonas sp.]|uniref:DUF1674 domain-containing protein n=1 Tax=Silanimonas sp. TaxID=1929290 RepID=UPI001BC3859A|nr:succinate dehydrogenase assembly factor 4 [Silanimonas sp.]MBS3896604.1 DUF1674 domain-containing protein [Silanimonas sp.]MBS3923913.1 DUF1674 domain-containing protein [Xanthomonadaceae bacterium]